MQRAIFISLIIFLCQGVTLLHGQRNDLDRDDLKGSVLSVRETVYSIPKTAGDSNSGDVISDIIHYYNDSGNRVKTAVYKKDKLFSYSIYSYNKDDIPVSIIEYNPDGSDYLTIDFICDEKGFITNASYNRDQQKSFDDERKSIDVEYDVYYQNLFTKVEHEYDYKGYELEAVHLTSNDKLAFKFYYSYDYKYNLIETKYYNNSGTLSWRKKMKYDTDGMLVRCRYYESNRIALTSVYDHEIDQSNNWVKRIETRSLHDNFFSEGLNDNTIITFRNIEYY